MQRTALSLTIEGALARPETSTSDLEHYRQHRDREALKRELDRLKGLVDAGRLGCIIVAELLDDSGTQVRSAHYGHPGLVLEVAARIVSRTSRGPADVRQTEGQVPFS